VRSVSSFLTRVWGTVSWRGPHCSSAGTTPRSGSITRPTRRAGGAAGGDPGGRLRRRDRGTDDSRLAELSDRERAILLEVARGRSNTEIAAALHIAEPTVKTCLGRLRSKLDLHERVQLVIFVYDSGLVAPRR